MSTSPFIYLREVYSQPGWVFFSLLSNTNVVVLVSFFLCTEISAAALSIFGLILKNAKAVTKESRLTLQKANINYLTTALGKFRREMARKSKPESPDRAVVL